MIFKLKNVGATANSNSSRLWVWVLAFREDDVGLYASR